MPNGQPSVDNFSPRLTFEGILQSIKLTVKTNR